MKKIIIVLLIAGISVFTMNSCNESFLDEEVYSSFAPETLNDPLGLEASIIGLHRHFIWFHVWADQQGWLSVWQVGTDIAWATQPQGIENPYFRYAELASTDGAASFTWEWAYKLIKNANVIIQNTHDREIAGMTEEEVDAVEAEAKFFRAYAYNFLVTMFGDVPLTTELITGPKTDFVRTAVSEIDELIEADLLFGAEHLKTIDNVNQGGRVNNAMARQLLAEAYLRMGRPADAETQCLEIINSGDFSLVKERYGVNESEPGDPFSDMFIFGNQRRSQGNTEGIWVFQAENPRDLPGAIGGNPQQRRVWGAGYHNKPGMIPADSLGGRGLSRLRLNSWVLYDLYPPGDMRNSQYNIKRQFVYNNPDDPNFGQIVVPDPSDTLFRIHPYTLKWRHFDPLDVFGFGMWKDFIFMRLGETYLLLAEARFKKPSPDLDGAADAINELRERANAPFVTADDIDLDFILDERVRELVGEENRRLTLVRTGTLVHRVETRNPPVDGNPGNINITGLTANHMLMPIPQNEIELNKDAVLTQNPGYGE